MWFTVCQLAPIRCLSDSSFPYIKSEMVKTENSELYTQSLESLVNLDLEVTVHEREKVIFGYDLRWVMQEPVYIFLSCSF